MSAVTPTLLSEGSPMDPALQIRSIDVLREVDRVPQAEIRVLDGDAARRRFAVSDSGFFDPGAHVEIKLRNEGQPDATVFKGVVVRQSVEADGAGGGLVIGLKDEAVKLALTRRSALFQDMTDDAILRQIVTGAGLTVGVLGATQPQHAAMVQYACTSWDFLLSRADALGLLVLVEDGRVSFVPMTQTGSPVQRFEYGMSDLLSFEIEADGSTQLEAVESAAWSLPDLALTAPSRSSATATPPGDLDAVRLAQALGAGVSAITHAVPLAAEEAQAFADATLARSRLSLCRGRISLPGTTAVKPLDWVEIQGVGRHYSGAALVTGTRHRVDLHGWRTDVQLGLSPERFSRREGIGESPAKGLLPAAPGLQIGVVAAFEADPTGELRVKVCIPAVDAARAVVWARLASPDAGSGRGAYVRPEPGDEVVLGFLADDPRHPVILGSLFGSRNAPPQVFGAPDAANEKRGMVTKAGTTIAFTDGQRPSVSIETAGGNKLLLDDDAEGVKISDSHGNTIQLNQSGVVLRSAGDFTIDASGDVQIKGTRVDIQ